MSDYLLFGLVVTTVIATGYLQGVISMVDILPAMLGGGAVAPLQPVMGALTLIGTFGLSDLVLVQ